MKKNIFILSILLPLAIFSSCTSSQNLNEKGNAINFTAIKRGGNSNYTKFTTVEIHNFKELGEVWGNFYAKYDRKPPIPTIDFEKNMLIAVALGERNAGSYSIQVKSILETKTNITIVVEENKPGASCTTASVMVYPFQLIEITQQNKPITYAKTLKVNDCNKGM
jgi:hypothetical protein